MKKFKIGQEVYYFRSDSQYSGHIITGIIKTATKDLATGEITYQVENEEFCWLSKYRLTAEHLYSSYKQALDEHKDELAYYDLMSRIECLENAVNRVFSDYAEKIEAAPGYATIKFDDTLATSSIVIDGIGDLREEFNKLKTEVENIKKKVKKPTKKTVKKEEVK